MNTKKFSVILASGIALASYAGCDREGPAERAGERADAAVAGDPVRTEGPGERAGERVGEVVDKALEGAGRVMQDAGEDLERSAQGNEPDGR